MESLAAYGRGESNNTTHHYAGTIDKKKKPKIHIKPENNGESNGIYRRSS